MNPERLRKIQRKIHAALEAQVDRLLGPLPEAIRRYERSYRKDFPERKLESLIEHLERHPDLGEAPLIEALRSVPVTLVGDYHTFAQAQRTALRLLREAWREDETWWLGVELLPSSLQGVLDAFQRGEISVPDFHAQIGYDREWGFPWNHYEPLFTWAREHRVRVIALNRPRPLLTVGPRLEALGRSRRTERDLEERDQWAAGIITDLFADARARKLPEPRMMVLYGELHLASAHLPRQIEKISAPFFEGTPLETLVVHQNFDPLYWKLARENLAERHAVVPVSRRVYFIFSGTPWGKLQSLVSWAELAGTVPKGPEHDLQARPGKIQDEEDDSDPGEDTLSELQALSRVIAEGFEVPAPDLSSLHVCTANDPEYAEHSSEDPRLTRGERTLARQLLRSNLRFHLPAVQTVFLGTPSPNALAEMAALLTLRSRTQGVQLFGDSPDAIAQHILESAGAFLGGSFINPRRKCDLRQDHLRRIRDLQQSKVRPIFKGELEARQLAAKLSRVASGKAFLRMIEKEVNVPAQTPMIRFMCGRYFGLEIGQRAARSLHHKPGSAIRIRHLLLARMDGRGRPLTDRIGELLELLPPEHSPRAKPRII